MTIQYDPQKVTDWVTPLEKVYARQSSQLDRYHQQLRERDRQEEAATLDLPEMFSKLASFSSSISKVMEARKAKQDTDFKERLANLTPEHIQLLNDAFRAGDLKNLKEDHNPYIKTAGKSKDLLFGKQLKEFSPRDIVMTKKFLVNANSKRLGPQVYLEQLEGNPDEFNTYKNASEPRQAEMYVAWVKSQNDHLRLNNGLFASSQIEEMRRLESTSKTNARSKAKAQILSTEQLKFKERTKLFFDNPDPYDGVLFINQEITDRAAFLKDIPGGKTAIQQATETVVGDIYDLGQAGEFSIDKLNKLFTGELKDHPAAKNIPDAFFDKEGKYYNHLTKGILEGETVKFKTFEATHEANAIQEMNKLNSGEYTQAQWDRIVLSFKGKVSNETYNTMTGLPAASSKPEIYKSDSEKLIETAETGNLELLKAEKEGAINAQAKAEAEKEIAFQEKHRKRLNYSERFLDIKVSEGLNLTLKTDEALNWKGVGVRNDLLAFFRKDFVARIKEDPKNPNALGESMAAVEDYWKANGGTEKGGTGKFSPTTNGTYDNFNEYNNLKSESYSELNTVATESKVNKYTDRVNTAWNRAKNNPNTKGENIIQRVLNTPESILDKEDIIAAYENTTISSEVRIKARQLGITPTQLLEWQTKALINGGDTYKEVVDLFDLKNKELPDPEKDLQEMVDDKDLLYLLRRVGIENTTPKQRFRLYQYLENRDASVKEKKEDQDTEKKVNQRALRYEYMK
tara:strand:- start:62 stop:2284 length:2223 start_codon:yes stop_codon:yes gene_type:complete